VRLANRHAFRNACRVAVADCPFARRTQIRFEFVTFLVSDEVERDCGVVRRKWRIRHLNVVLFLSRSKKY
jgi:hypothetical protein